MRHREQLPPEGVAPAIACVSAIQAANQETPIGSASGAIQMQPHNSSSDKVLKWLDEQGYPTEFQVANICARHGFRVFQGYHVRSENPDIPREIDVLAQMDEVSKDYLIRVCHVIECKWSKDKPLGRPYEPSWSHGKSRVRGTNDRQFTWVGYSLDNSWRSRFA
jgi:hypothetical protein